MLPHPPNTHTHTCTHARTHTHRYNLLREDSEGYAKLVVALNMFGDAALTPELVDPLYKEIQVCVGGERAGERERGR